MNAQSVVPMLLPVNPVKNKPTAASEDCGFRDDKENKSATRNANIVTDAASGEAEQLELDPQVAKNIEQGLRARLEMEMQATVYLKAKIFRMEGERRRQVDLFDRKEAELCAELSQVTQAYWNLVRGDRDGS